MLITSAISLFYKFKDNILTRSTFLLCLIVLTAGCKSDSECPLSQACNNRECKNPCLYAQCGINADCSVLNHRTTKCTCRAGYEGNPNEKCRQQEQVTESKVLGFLFLVFVIFYLYRIIVIISD